MLTQIFKDSRIREVCEKALIRKFRENPQSLSELNIPNLGTTPLCSLAEFTVLTVAPDDSDPSAAILGFDVTGFINGYPLLGTAEAKITGLSNEVVDWKNVDYEFREYIFGLKLDANILSYHPIAIAKRES